MVRVTEHGKVIYRASALGRCTRALLAARQGVLAAPPPAEFANPERTGYFDRGLDAEETIVETLGNLGFNIHERQAEVRLEFGDAIVLGHIDGLTEPGKTNYGDVGAQTHLLEIKHFGTSNWAKWRAGHFSAFPVYALQVSCYMHALGLPRLCMVIHNGNTGAFDISLHGAAPRELWEIETIVTGVEQLYKLAPPIGTVECTRDYPCPYSVMHDVPIPLDGDLVPLARAYDLFDQKIKSWTVQRDEFKTRLRERLSIGRYMDKDISVTVSDGGSRRLDLERVKTLFQKAKVDIDDYYKQIPGDNRITISVKKPKTRA